MKFLIIFLICIHWIVGSRKLRKRKGNQILLTLKDLKIEFKGVDQKAIDFKADVQFKEEGINFVNPSMNIESYNLNWTYDLLENCNLMNHLGPIYTKNDLSKIQMTGLDSIKLIQFNANKISFESICNQAKKNNKKNKKKETFKFYD